MNKRVWLGMGCAGLLSFSVTSFAATQNNATSQTSQTPAHHKVKHVSKKYHHRMGNPAAATQAGAIKQQASASTATSASSTPVLQLNPDNALQINTGNKSYSMKVYGEVFVDHSAFDGAYNTDSNGNGHFGQHTELQTARLGIAGNLQQNWGYNVYLANRANATNDNNDDVYVRNAFITYSGWQWAQVMIGKQNPYFGIDNMHDDNNTYGTNFALLSNGFAPPISTGVSLHNFIDTAHLDWYLGALHTGTNINDSANNTRGGQGYQSESVVYVGRVGWAPIHQYDQHRVFYVSASEAHYNGSNSPVSAINLEGSVSGTMTYDSNPPITSGVFAPSLAQSYSNVYDAGFSSECGPLSLEGEYAYMLTSLEGGFNDKAHYDDAYLQAGYVLTGESRTFDPQDGYLLGVTNPQGRYGAWELIGRAEHVNLVSDAGVAQAAIGDRATAYTVGVNWYVNKHVRFALDGTHMHLAGPSATTSSGNGATVQVGYVF